MPFNIVHNDITKMDTEVIVNASNSKLIPGGGVCGAIFKAAKDRNLEEECFKIGGCAVGQAVITKGYNLKAKHIIHTVGPIWKGGEFNEEELLISAYKSSLELAKANNLNSIAFPLISSGIYGYPKEKALKVAVSVISNFLENNDMDIYLVVFDRKAVILSESLYEDISHYIDEYYEGGSNRILFNRVREESEIMYASELLSDKCLNLEDDSVDAKYKRSLKDVLENIDETFSEMLLRLIDEKEKSDVQVYKKANIDRKLFSKIRSKKNYNPKKSTALSLAIALELSLDETKDLLAKAGYTLSPSQKFDVIIQYFIENKNYDIYLINEALFSFEQPLLAM